MPGPFDDLARAFGVPPDVVNAHVASDWNAQRKRLREVRRRMVEEQEQPTDYFVEHTDEYGRPMLDPKTGGAMKTQASGFQIGRVRDRNPVPPKLRDGFQVVFPMAPDSGLTDDDLTSRLDEILAEVETFEAPGIYRESPHPEIQEGEAYGDYVARVARDYERQAGEAAVRRPEPHADSVRQSTATHPDCDGSTIATRPGLSGEDRESIHRDRAAGAYDSGDAGQRDSGTGADPASDAGNSDSGFPSG